MKRALPAGVFPTLCVASVSLLTFFLLFVGQAHAQNATSCPYIWTRTLNIGSDGTDVLKLQQFLNSDPATSVAATGPGSSGNETDTFGSLTKSAVMAFQQEYASEILTPNGLSAPTGIVGPATRAQLNTLCSTSVVPLPAPSALLSTSSVITLSVTAGDQPAATLAPAGAIYVPFTNVQLTAESGDVMVNDVTVQRVGPSQDQAFPALDLFVDGNYQSTAYLGSNHEAVFQGPFTVPTGTTTTLSITGEMNTDLSQYDGEMAGFALVAIDTSAQITGTLPISGTLQTLNNSLAIGTVYASLSPYDPNTSQARTILSTGVIFSGIRLTAGPQEDLTLSSITWEQSGSAGVGDLANVATVVNGVAYPASVDSTGHYYTSTFPAGVVIQKGETVDAYIQGDLTDTGSNRTVEFDIQYPTDVVIAGNTYGYSLYLVPGNNTATEGNSVFLTSDGTTDGTSLTPFFVGSVTNIDPGTAESISAAN